MSLSKARQLREQRAKLVADAQLLIPAEGQTLTPENRTKFDTMMADADALKGDIDRLERAEALELEMSQTRKLPESQPGAAADPAAGTDRAASVKEFRTALRKHGVAAIDKVRPESRAIVESINTEYWDALKDYLQRGDGMKPESRALLQGVKPEYRDMGIGTNTLGGYFVPQGFVHEVEQALKYYGDMLNVSEILDTATGQPLPYPTDNDTTNTGEIIGEGQQVTTQDITIGHINFGAFKFSTKMIKVSLELVQDSAFDMEGFIKNKFSIRLGRILNTKFTVGVGTTEPTGIVTAVVANNTAPNATPAYGTGLIAAGSATNTGGAETGTTSIGSQDLSNLESTVDPLYRKGAKYMFHDQTLRVLRGLLDKYGRPLWTPGMANNAPDQINGYSYSINNDMATIAASANTVLFGQLKKYMIRRVKELGVMRLNERFADYGQVAFIGFARYDGNLLDAGTHPVSYLQQHS